MAGPGRSGGDDGAATPAGPDRPPAETAGSVGAEPPPLISVGPPSGSSLPHWTEPPTLPTDEVAPPTPTPPPGDDGPGRPAVKPIPANGARPPRPAPEAVAAVVSPSAPAAGAAEHALEGDPDGPVSGEVPTGGNARWRGAGDDWLDGDTSFADLVADGDTRIGQHDEMRDEQYLTFEDLDVPQADLPTVPPRGSADDPILIQRTGGTAPVEAAGGDEPGDPAELAPAEPVAAGHHAEGSTLDDDGERPVPAPPAPPGRNRGQAIKVGLGIAAAALAVFLIGALVEPLRWLPLLLVAAAIVGAMVELFNAAVGAGYRPVNLVGVAAGAALPVTAYFAGSPTIPNGESGIVLVVFLSLVAAMAWYLFGAGRGRPVPNIAVTLLGIVYIGVLGSFAALILRAGPWPGTTGPSQGIPLVILVVLGTELYDAGGYLLGSRLGRTPLSAASPSKTREGLVFGMACAIASVVLLGGVAGIGVRDMTQAVILAVVIAVVAPVGDLFESLLKRDLGVKDMSTLIPSHGGLLDRVDALLFTLPACYYTLRILGLI